MKSTALPGSTGGGGIAHPGGAALLGFRNLDTLALHQRVEKGFSFRTFEQLQKHLDISMSELAELVSIKPRTLSRRRESRRLTPEESDRVLRLSRIFARTLNLFEGDASAARKWFTTPLGALAGEAPQHFATTDVGAREVENLIGRLEHGIFS